MDILARNKKSIFAGLIVIIVVTLGAFWFFRSGTKNECKLESKAPTFENSQLVASKDETAIANMQGYLKFGNESEFLRLELKEIDVKKKKPEYFYRMYSPCAQLSLTLNQKDKLITFGSISFRDVYNHNDMADCKLEPSTNFQDEEYYSCPGLEISILESTKDIAKFESTKDIAKVHFDNFEFELEGDKEKIKQGKFSKKAKKCEDGVKKVKCTLS